MNWTCPWLDDYRLAANSDAHSLAPRCEGREFSAEPDFSRRPARPGTGSDPAAAIDFYPDDDKYCLDGRRNYGAHFAGGTPGEHDGSHPECGKTLMIGYVYRVAYRGG